MHEDDIMVDSHVQDGSLYMLYKLCVPKGE